MERYRCHRGGDQAEQQCGAVLEMDGRFIRADIGSRFSAVRA
jgi:hypothetical protein